MKMHFQVIGLISNDIIQEFDNFEDCQLYLLTTRLNEDVMIRTIFNRD